MSNQAFKNSENLHGGVIPRYSGTEMNPLSLFRKKKSLSITSIVMFASKKRYSISYYGISKLRFIKKSTLKLFKRFCIYCRVFTVFHKCVTLLLYHNIPKMLEIHSQHNVIYIHCTPLSLSKGATGIYKNYETRKSISNNSFRLLSWRTSCLVHSSSNSRRNLRSHSHVLCT